MLIWLRSKAPQSSETESLTSLHFHELSSMKSLYVKDGLQAPALVKQHGNPQFVAQ